MSLDIKQCTGLCSVPFKNSILFCCEIVHFEQFLLSSLRHKRKKRDENWVFACCLLKPFWVSVIMTCVVATSCCTSDEPCQWETTNFNPPPLSLTALIFIPWSSWNSNLRNLRNCHFQQHSSIQDYILTAVTMHSAFACPPSIEQKNWCINA